MASRSLRRCRSSLRAPRRRAFSQDNGGGGASLNFPPPQDRDTLVSAWSFLQRANPFVVWGESVGREPSDGLPDLFELVATVLGVSGKSAGEVSDYARDAHSAFERYVDDLGFERRSVMEIVAKDEAQSLEDFTEGALGAREAVRGRLARPGDFDDLPLLFGDALAAAARDGAFAPPGDDDAAPPGDGAATPPGDDAAAAPGGDAAADEGGDAGDAGPRALVARVAFAVRGTGLRVADLAPRSGGLMARFERAVQRWHYEPCAPPDGDGDGVLLRESSGLFVGAFHFAPDVLEALDGGPPAAAIGDYLAARDLTWPVPNDAQQRLADDAEAAARSMRGWIFVDVVFPDATMTFAREVDRRADARWDADWLVVDVDGAVAGHDHGKLLATFE